MGRANILLPSHHSNLGKPATVAGAPHGFAAATDRKLITGDAAIGISMTLWECFAGDVCRTGRTRRPR